MFPKKHKYFILALHDVVETTTTIKFPKTAGMAIMVVVAAIGVTAVQTISMMSVQSASADPDRCVSRQTSAGPGLIVT